MDGYGYGYGWSVKKSSGGRKEFTYLTMHIPLNYTTGLGVFTNPKYLPKPEPKKPTQDPNCYTKYPNMTYLLLWGLVITSEPNRNPNYYPKIFEIN